MSVCVLLWRRRGAGELLFAFNIHTRAAPNVWEYGTLCHYLFSLIAFDFWQTTVVCSLANNSQQGTSGEDQQKKKYIKKSI